MKKLFAILAAAALAFCVSSCGEKTDGPAGGDQLPTLIGTVWTGSYSYVEDGINYTDNYTLAFQETTFTMVTTWLEDGKTESQTDYGNYVYNAPNVIVKMGEKENEWVKGTVTSKQMSLTDYRGVTVIFTRALLK